MFIIGLTGGIGCGKSRVEALFRALKIEVIEADALAKEVVAPGQPALEALLSRLGNFILLPDGSLNRRLMRTLMFQDQALRHFIEQQIHPRVRVLFQERLKTVRSPYVIFSIPLLLEHDLHSMVDRILVVDSAVELQITRTMARDQVTEMEVRAIIDAQISREERRDRADDLLENNGSLEELSTAVQALHQQYLDLC